MYIEGDVPVVTTGNNNGFGFGGGWEGLIGLALVAGLFGNGWGFGGFGGNRGGSYGGIADNYVLATDFATIERKLDGVNNGICDSTFALNNTITNGFFGVQNSLTQGFSGLNTALLQGNYSLSSQLADCCCTTQRGIDALRYDISKGLCDVIRSGQDNTRDILNYLTTEKISSLQAENSGLKAQISNDRQSAYIINELAPKCPQPAYVVQPPQQVTFPTNCCGNVAYASYNNGCSGCNNF
jgi:hypothetical protein